MRKQLLKKAFDEGTMLMLGTGVALTGMSMVIIGAHAVRKSNWYNGGVMMTIGVVFASVGTQVAIGAVERARGLR